MTTTTTTTTTVQSYRDLLRRSRQRKMLEQALCEPGSRPQNSHEDKGFVAKGDALTSHTLLPSSCPNCLSPTDSAPTTVTFYTFSPTSCTGPFPPSRIARRSKPESETESSNVLENRDDAHQRDLSNDARTATHPFYYDGISSFKLTYSKRP